MAYLYEGSRVQIPGAAEVSGAFRPNNSFGEEVQAALDDIQPWEKGEDPYHTFELSRAIGARVVALDQAELPDLRWGVNPFHTASDPGLSPYTFLRRSDERQGGQYLPGFIQENTCLRFLG